MKTGAMSARQLVRETAARLESSDVPEARASAEVLLSELLGVRRGEIAALDPVVTREQASTYGAWIPRREAREPVQRILGYAYFRNLKLRLGEHTLIPRPDTESVVEAALETIDDRNGACRVLDLGTGSGAIAVSIAQERPACEVHAADVSEAALKVARSNAESAGVQIRFHSADVAVGLEELNGTIQLLVSNPPYIPTGDLRSLASEVHDWDPHSALDGGPDGLTFYRRIFVETPPLLADQSNVVLEVGDDQSEAVLELGREAGFKPLGTRQDLTGSPRAAMLRWSG